jgi:hypothetical protein
MGIVGVATIPICTNNRRTPVIGIALDELGIATVTRLPVVVAVVETVLFIMLELVISGALTAPTPDAGGVDTDFTISRACPPGDATPGSILDLYVDVAITPRVVGLISKRSQASLPQSPTFCAWASEAIQ